MDHATRHGGLGYGGVRPARGEGHGPKGYVRSDARIRDDVCLRIAEADDVDASDVEVRVADGEVTLIGTARSLSDKITIEDVAAFAPGVRDITNLIRVVEA